jgi:molybdenum cofactor biosynthesis enzyme MoaA
MSLPAVPLPRYPSSPLVALDTLWLQVAGTLCNIECRHCFISSSPTNRAHEMMTLPQVRRWLDEAKGLGVREYYFTGGEPFLNRELPDMLALTLAQGPATVLTNGLLITEAAARRLRELADGTEYSLDIRVSIDGWDAATNDPIRGEGTFDRIMAGVSRLAAAGINPVLTVTEACEGAASNAGRARFLEFLRAAGLRQPRLKVMPLLRLGAEETRTRAYQAWESLAGRTLTPSEAEALQCSSSRMVTARGVYVCPILIDSPAARMASSLAGALRPFELSFRACYTCHEQGLSCRT